MQYLEYFYSVKKDKNSLKEILLSPSTSNWSITTSSSFVKYSPNFC